MAFDWETYKDLAERLRREDDEAAKRSAISRLYYSIYHKAKNFLENESDDFYFSENKPAHQQIWNEFIRKGGTYKAIGGNGKRLLNSRNDADYEDDFSKLDEALVTSFRIAENISDYLRQIQPK